MHRLFSRIPRGLDPIADIFKEHVDGEGMKLVKEAASAAETKREKEKDAGGWGCLGWRGWALGGGGVGRTGGAVVKRAASGGCGSGAEQSRATSDTTCSC
jgi:hypothetical protein